MTPANYLVQTEDGTLHTYWRLDVLLIDLASQRATPPVRLFRWVGGLAPKYVPTTEAELRSERRSA
jgi:hypothetical protein